MMSSNSAAKRQEEQLRREQRLQQLSLEKTNLDNTAQSINNYINTITNEPEYIPYATGGAIRRRRYDEDVIQGRGRKYRLRDITGQPFDFYKGPTHANGGIDVRVSGKEVELENNEVVRKVPGGSEAISPELPSPYGGSIAQAVVDGTMSLDEASVYQDRLKSSLGLPKSPVGRGRYKAPFGFMYPNVYNRRWATPYSSMYTNDPLITSSGPGMSSLANAAVASTPGKLATLKSTLPYNYTTTSRTGKRTFADRLGAEFKPVDFGLLGVNTILPFFARSVSRANAERMRGIIGDYKKALNEDYAYHPAAYTSFDTKVRSDAKHAATEINYQSLADRLRGSSASSNKYGNDLNELAANRMIEHNKIFDEDRATNVSNMLKDAEMRNNFNIAQAEARSRFDQAKMNTLMSLMAQEAGVEESIGESNEGLIQALINAAGGFVDTGMKRLNDSKRMRLAAATADRDTWNRLVYFLPELGKYRV